MTVKKDTPGPAFCLKAALAATIASAVLFGGLFCAAVLTGGSPDWRRALPAGGMSAAQAEDALMRAKYLHEAAVRPQLILAGFASGDDLLYPGDRPARFRASDEPASAFLVQALWALRAMPEAHDSMLRDLLDTARLPAERLADFRAHAALLDAALPFITENPGLPATEYIFWGKYKEDLRRLAGRVAANPGRCAFPLGGRGKLGAAAAAALRDQGAFPLGGHDGPGMTLTRVKTFRPEHSPKKQISADGLYLLADMGRALENAPPCDLARAYPIFRGMLFRHMPDQPLVLPLDPKSESDRKVIDWYAAEGWKHGRTLLFSAAGEPADIARHWGSVHLLWWPGSKNGGDREPAPAYLRPEHGHFLLAMTRNLKGKDVSRFFGSVTGLWFGRRNVDAAGWAEELYEVRPAADPARTARTTPIRSPLWDRLSGARPENEKPVYSEATAAIVLDEELHRAIAETGEHDYRIALARMLERSCKDATAPPRELYAFVEKALEKIDAWDIRDDGLRTLAVEYLWRFQNDPEALKIIRDVLTEKGLPPHELLRMIRRSLGCPGHAEGGRRHV